MAQRTLTANHIKHNRHFSKLYKTLQNGCKSFGFAISFENTYVLENLYNRFWKSMVRFCSLINEEKNLFFRYFLSWIYQWIEKIKIIPQFWFSSKIASSKQYHIIWIDKTLHRTQPFQYEIYLGSFLSCSEATKNSSNIRSTIRLYTHTHTCAHT